jgi:hypothetical protein
MKRIDIAIEQVAFEHSDLGLGVQLRRMRGVSDVKIDHELRIAHITFDDQRLSVADVRRLVDGCGYGYGTCTLPAEVAR